MTDKDALDGCEVINEGGWEHTPDDEILEVVFGDDPAKWEAYRAWFGALATKGPNDDG